MASNRWLNVTLFLLLSAFSVFALNRVNGDFPDFSNMGAQIRQQVRASMPDLSNLGAQIQQQVQSSIPDLSNLGAQIEQEVQQGLIPVYQMTTLLNLKNGVGGTTIVTYQPSGRQFIAEQGTLYQCAGGPIDQTTGQCSRGPSDRQRFQPGRQNTDFCFANSYAQVNDDLCVGFGSGFSVTSINGRTECRASHGTRILHTTRAEFGRMCRPIADSAHYRYITSAIPQHYNPGDVQCQGGQPVVCTHVDSRRLGNAGSVNVVNISGSA